MNTHPLTIALDARSIHGPSPRGTGKNLRDLYRTVLEMRPDWSVVAFHRGEDARGISCDRYRPRRIEMRGDRFDAWERIRLPLAAWRAGADLLHRPANLCDTPGPVPALVTIHDLLPYTHGSRRLSARFARTARLAARSGTTVITPSAYTRDRLVETFGLGPEQIVVNPWAPDSRMRRVTDDALLADTARRYGVAGRYMLHLGAPDPRKNTEAVIRAWAALAPPVRADCRLLVIGLDDVTHLGRLAAVAERLGARGSVILGGFADEADLPALLSGAEALIYPSLHEGFGLPILDAWVAETPVLTADNSALTEVAADAALLVDAQCTRSIADGIARLLTECGLCEVLVARGAERCGRYTWRATAERFIHAVERAAGRARRDSRDAA